MQEFSKYRMITAGIILMFIFAIAAIYTNTKDATIKKTQGKTSVEQQLPQPVIGEATKIENPEDFTTQNNNTTINNNETNNQFLQITERLDELERKVFAPQNNNDGSVRCTVQGILNDGHIIPLSSQEAVNESRTNGKEVLITCVFK